MPLYDFLCADCGTVSEILTNRVEAAPECPHCGGRGMKKMLSAPSSLSGVTHNRVPGAGDTACCGNSPHQAGCAGPGSCCGKMPH
jgi:putative FmdB family regulatory protein